MPCFWYTSKNKSHSKYGWNGEAQWTTLPEKTADLKEDDAHTYLLIRANEDCEKDDSWSIQD